MSQTSEDKLLIADLLDALLFDAENCDFGPAYGMWESRRKDAIVRARKALQGWERPKPPLLKRTGRQKNMSIFE